MSHINPAPYRKCMPPDEAPLFALLAVIDLVRNALELTGRKNHEHDFTALDAAHAVRVSMLVPKRRRPSPKRDKLLLYAGVLQQLIDKGCSLRQIQTYLKKYLGRSLNHTYLRKSCLDMGLLPE